jgi:hypothetical protein
VQEGANIPANFVVAAAAAAARVSILQACQAGGTAGCTAAPWHADGTCEAHIGSTVGGSVRGVAAVVAAGAAAEERAPAISAEAASSGGEGGWGCACACVSVAQATHGGDVFFGSGICWWGEGVMGGGARGWQGRAATCATVGMTLAAVTCVVQLTEA